MSTQYTEKLRITTDLEARMNNASISIANESPMVEYYTGMGEDLWGVATPAIISVGDLVSAKIRATPSAPQRTLPTTEKELITHYALAPLVKQLGENTKQLFPAGSVAVRVVRLPDVSDPQLAIVVRFGLAPDVTVASVAAESRRLLEIFINGTTPEQRQAVTFVRLPR